MDHPHIRRAQVADARSIARVHVASSEEAYRPLAGEWKALDEVEQARKWEGWLTAWQDDPTRVEMVAEVDGDVVGFATAGLARRDDLETNLELHVIHVLPSHRGRGVGGRLWSATCAEVRGAECKSLYVATFAELRCCSFYEARGGELVEREPGSYQGGEVTKIVYRWAEGRSSDERSPPDLYRSVIRRLNKNDPERIAAAFAALGWNKPVEKYRRYVTEQADGMRVVLVAESEDAFAGYVTLVWDSAYPPFREHAVPEIQDFNVLPAFRRRGVGTALMDAAEALAAERGPVVGIGVGMDPDYGPAQAMYVRRGYVPDARGLTSHRRHVVWGDTVQVDDDLVLYFTKQLTLPALTFPERRTRRLLLRPVEVADVASVYEIYSNPQACEFLDILPYAREEQARAHIQRWRRLAAAGRQFRCAIELEGQVVGTCGLYSIARHQNRATLGCDLHPDYWKRGLMTEALAEFLSQCFGAWSFTRIQALVLPGHRASIALLGGLGFAEEGLLRSYEIWEGRGEVDLLMYSKTRNARQSGPGSSGRT